MEVIRSKTAKLFEAAGQLGAVLGAVKPEVEISMAQYGMHLGTAFQLIDDVLDYQSSSEKMGKNVGDDLSEGKPTLPLIYAMAKGTKSQAEIIRRAIEEGGLDHLDEILSTIESTGAIKYTEQLAKNEVRKAVDRLAGLAGSAYKGALTSLAEFSVDRIY